MARRRPWWAAIATSGTCRPRMSLPRMAASRVFASMKIMSRCNYAMRRHADGMFNARTGRYDGISTAYRLKLVPVFVVDPDKPMDIPNRDSDSRRRKAFDDTAAAMIKAVDTLVPQEVPPGSGELTAVDGVEIGRGGVALPGRGRRGYGGNRVADDKAKPTPEKPDPR